MLPITSGHSRSTPSPGTIIRKSAPGMRRRNFGTFRTPRLLTGEVVDDVEAASVNGFDLVVAAGYLWDAVPHTFPACPGATSSAPSAPSAQPSTMYRWATASPGYSAP
jgi:hypothetical protein